MLVTSHYAVIAINALTYCKFHMLESLLQIMLESLLGNYKPRILLLNIYV